MLMFAPLHFPFGWRGSTVSGRYPTRSNELARVANAGLATAMKSVPGLRECKPMYSASIEEGYSQCRGNAPIPPAGKYHCRNPECAGANEWDSRDPAWDLV